jgi:hypothetical protein
MASGLLGQLKRYCSKYNNGNKPILNASASSNKRDRIISGQRWTCNSRQWWHRHGSRSGLSGITLPTGGSGPIRTGGDIAPASIMMVVAVEEGCR